MRKDYVIPLVRKNKTKNKMHDFNCENNEVVYEKNAEKINIYHPRAHFIVIYNSSLVFAL